MSPVSIKSLENKIKAASLFIGFIDEDESLMSFGRQGNKKGGKLWPYGVTSECVPILRIYLIADLFENDQ